MVPDHPPEIFSGVRQGMLGNDELIAPVVALVVVRKRIINKSSNQLFLVFSIQQHIDK